MMGEVETGNQTTPSSSATLRPWWSRPIQTSPASTDGDKMYCASCWGGLFTIIAVFLILIFLDKVSSHAKVSIKSIDVSPSTGTATWNIDFLIKNPSSRYSIYYDGDDASVRLGHLSAAVLNTSHIRTSKHETAYSLTFVTEGNKSGVVSEELDVQLRAKHKRYIDNDQAGLINIRCQNLTGSHDNIDKIKCQSFFKPINLIDTCYVELFVPSVTVSNAVSTTANVSTSDWKIGLVTKTRVLTGCKIPLYTIKSRLLRGDNVISDDSLGQLVTSGKSHNPVINMDFKTVEMARDISGVVWDIRVEIVAGVQTDDVRRHDFLMVFCRDIPVKFTKDPSGNMIGSLLGNKRRCDFLVRDNLMNLPF